MNRFRELDRYQKILLLALLAMAVIFAAVYGITATRVGYRYNDAILVPRQTEGALVYEGKVDGQDTSIIVALDTVVVNMGSKTYGPYSIQDDPSAVPEGHSYMIGIVILCDDHPIFRGGVANGTDGFWLVNEDGSPEVVIGAYTMGDGIEYDMNGNPIDPLKPTPQQIISLLRGPELTHKGQLSVWFVVTLIGLLTAFSILFADELFYLSICFRVQNAETAEPSDWAITSRNIAWFLMTLLIAGAYLTGLQV